jgi:hypothetical protein
VRVAVVMPVGPGQQELERCRVAAESLTREPSVRRLVLVDDTGDRLAGIDGPGVVTVPHPLRGSRANRFDRIAAATLAGLEWVAERDAADLVMKLDTDSLVIAPFAEKLSSALADPAIGMAGSYDITCNGDPRSFLPWVRKVRRASRIVQPRRIALSRRAWRARRIIRQARQRGYVWGEHPLACAVAVTRPALEAMRDEGRFLDPLTFLGTGLGDDPILAILVRRAGLRIVGHVRDGETFAVAWHGLPDTPSRLAERGYSIIHSVKNDERFSEREIIESFRLHGGDNFARR